MLGTQYKEESKWLRKVILQVGIYYYVRPDHPPEDYILQECPEDTSVHQSRQEHVGERDAGTILFNGGFLP